MLISLWWIFLVLSADVSLTLLYLTRCSWLSRSSDRNEALSNIKYYYLHIINGVSLSKTTILKILGKINTVEIVDLVHFLETGTQHRLFSKYSKLYCVEDFLQWRIPNLREFNSIQFSLFPAHINISYNNDNVHIMCRKRGRTEDSAYERPSPKNNLRMKMHIEQSDRRY